MSRDYLLYAYDMSNALRKIEKYTKGMDKEVFFANGLVQDAVIRNLEIVGEAAKKMPEDIRKKHGNVEWKKIAGLRDILIH